MWNNSRFRPGSQNGFYESYFLRANDDSRPLAFWIRYTIFNRRGRPEDACGELWAIYFDGESGDITAVKQSIPIGLCRFSTDQLDIEIDGSTLTESSLVGRIESPRNSITWSLEYSGGEPPLLLMPEQWYEGKFPKAKVLVGKPNAEYVGMLKVNGRSIPVEGWQGSQNHNWGSQHTDRYAWGQIAGFDNAPDTFLECSTANLKLGPLLTPPLTLLVLRDQGEEIAIKQHSAGGSCEGKLLSVYLEVRHSKLRGPRLRHYRRPSQQICCLEL
jgi:hypothetical protein